MIKKITIEVAEADIGFVREAFEEHQRSMAGIKGAKLATDSEKSMAELKWQAMERMIDQMGQVPA